MNPENLMQISVLLVEDDDVIMYAMKELLLEYVQSLMTAKDGLEGLGVYREKKPDLIITDVSMPNMDGLEMAREIRQDDAEIPIIVLTAFSDEAYMMESIDIGVNGYVLKPVKGKVLLERLEGISKQILYNRQAKREYELWTQKLQLASKIELLSDIAHHWRQPLSYISLGLSTIEDVLSMEGGCSPEVKNQMGTLEVVVQKLSSSITEFSTVYAAGRHEEEDTHNVCHLLEQALKIFTPSLEENGFVTTFDCEKDISMICNSTQFVHNINHIIRNSIDAKRNHDIKQPTLHIEVVERNHRYEISFVDNCGGASEEILKKAFEPYSTTKFKALNIGISLYEVYKFVTYQLRGEIAIENHQEGCLTMITIPRVI